MNLRKYLKQQAMRFQEKILLWGEGGTGVSYQGFDNITDRIAYGLCKLGICSGDRVAVLHPNHMETLIAYYSILKAGGVVVPVNSAYTAPEMKFIFNNSGAKVVMTSGQYFSTVNNIRTELPHVEHVVVRKDDETFEEAFKNMLEGPLKAVEEIEIASDATAFMIYTSGTTGNPKGVLLTHRNFCFGGPNMAQAYGLTESDITVAVLPLCHIFAIASSFFGSLSSGGSVVVAERFKPQNILEVIGKFGVTWFPGVPTMFIFLLSALPNTACDLSTLRMGLSGGASLPVDVLKRWEEETHAPILEVYGLTESTGLVTANPVYGERKAGSIGINVSGVDVKVVNANEEEIPNGEVGELIFRGPNATKGYFGLSAETSEKIKEGWVHTGDHAYKDEDGYFYIVGREKELIISGGYNIYPREIEEVIQSNKAVQEVAVIGIPDPHKGEIPKAYVSLKEGVSLTDEELSTYCGKSLARYKVPKIQFMKELPKNQTGKIMKKDLPKD